MEVVWVEGVFVGTLSLSTEEHSMEMPMLLPRCQLEGVQLETYIQASSSLVPECPPTLCSPKHQGSYITYFSHKSILIQVFNDFKYLPRGPLKKQCSASL